MSDPKQYDQIADIYTRGYQSISKKFINTGTFLHLLSKYGIENKEVIDLACGSGYLTRLIKDFQPARLVGIDISPEQIRLAREIEKIQNQGIEYHVGDVTDMDKINIGKFDFATALFLLNYSSTKQELQQMCDQTFQILRENGVFMSITPNSAAGSQKSLKYELTIEMPEDFKEGDQKTVTYFSKGKKLFSFQTYIWSKEIYENALKQAGFKEVTWHQPVISKKGIDKYGTEFWNEFFENPYLLGLTAVK